MPELHGQKVLVTGSSGVIGRELVDRLARRGADILSVDRLPFPCETHDRFKHLQLDLAEADLGPLSDFDPRFVFHLAASFERSHESPDFWGTNWHDNVLASHRLLDAVSGVDRVRAVVFASSYLVYSPALYMSSAPAPDTRVLREQDALSPRNLCGVAKLYTEREIDFQREVAGRAFRTAHARIYRVYGRGSRDVLSRWVRAALRGEEITVYHPENRFDYVYAGDVAEGLARLAESDKAEGPINIGTWRGRAIGEALDILKGLAKRGAFRVRTVEEPEPYEASCADVSRLRSLVGWTPPTTLEEGMRAIWSHESSGRS